MKQKINIFVIGHKKLNTQKFPGRKIIYVGKNHNCISNKIDIFTDNTGKNISNLNPYYCELTALYWVWKNYDESEYVGFEHYRRNFYHCCKIAKPDWLLKKVQKYDFYHAQTLRHKVSVSDFWKQHEGRFLLPILDKAIKKINPSYYADWQKIMNGKKMTYCNIFVCKRDLFDKYMEFIFPILNECFNNIKSLSKDEQARSVGFIAERLFDVFIQHNNLSHKAGFVYFNKKCKDILA